MRVGFLVLTYRGTSELTALGLRYLDGDLDPALLGSPSTVRDGPDRSRR
jgi:hypothetical protein